MLRFGVQRTALHSLRTVVSTAPQKQLTVRSFHNPSNLLERLFNAPKGFEKFFRKGNTGSTTKETPLTKDGGANASKTGGAESKNAVKGGKPGGTGGGNGGGDKKGDGKSNFPWIPVGLLATAGVVMMMVDEDTISAGKEITFQDFLSTILETGRVERVVVVNKDIVKVVLRPQVVEAPEVVESESTTEENNKAVAPVVAPAAAPESNHEQPVSSLPIELPNPLLNLKLSNPSQFFFRIGSVENFEMKLESAQHQLGIDPHDFIPVVYSKEISIATEVMRFVPTLLLIGAIIWISRGAMGGSGGPGGIFKVGKSTAKKINKESVTTTFADVAGCDEAKREIMEFVQFLKDPKRFTDLGAKIPKGALLCGPPGTGKTLLAKATAGEAHVPFYTVSGSDFIEMYVGVGASRVRDLFKEARANAPCIVFIDEIDAIGKQRGRNGSHGGHDEREATLNQLLVEMDGFDSTTNVVILAGTNRIDVLDSALKRPGRFDRQITVDRPDIKGRKAIFEVYLKSIRIDGEVGDYASRLAALTPGFVGADVANICNEAAIVAARRDKTKVDLSDFESATERIIGGLESKKIMTPEEKRIVAYHEAGHAVAGWNLEFADPLLKVTIVPRSSGALGFAQYLPKELYLRTREQILDTVCMALAGRASEQVTFGRVTTGASDDLRRVTNIIYQMVQVYGMNDKIGQLAFPKEEGEFRNYSEKTAELMDVEVRKMVDEAYERTLKLITDKRDQVEKVAQLLMAKETITNLDVQELIGKRPYSAGAEYEEYLQSGWKNTVTPLATAVDTSNAVDNSASDNNNNDNKTLEQSEQVQEQNKENTENSENKNDEQSKDKTQANDAKNSST